MREPGQIEDLTDLLVEDWAQLGRVREMGGDTQKFFRQEMERTWGQKHLAIFPEDEAQKWVLGVCNLMTIVNRDESTLVVAP